MLFVQIRNFVLLEKLANLSRAFIADNVMSKRVHRRIMGTDAARAKRLSLIVSPEVYALSETLQFGRPSTISPKDIEVFAIRHPLGGDNRQMTTVSDAVETLTGL
jgi:hypothetical protein